MNIEQLKDYIAQSRIDLVFKELKTFFDSNPQHSLINRLKVVNGQWTNFKKEEMFMTAQEKALAKTRIDYTVLEFLDELKPVLTTATQSFRILFLSANPADTTQLKLDTEFVEIQKRIQNSTENKKLELFIDTHVTLDKLHNAVQKYRPNIFHFSGHGFGTGELKEESRSVEKPPILSGLIIEDERGNRKILSQSALDGLFELIAKESKVELVLLNACYSAEQATTIKKYVQNVIGMTESISDRAAIVFSTGFYRALANGKDIETAYKYGINSIEIEGLNEQHKIILV
jgi:hypothetical protein